MCKFIKFKLIKDPNNKRVIFIPLEYNTENKFNAKSVDVDFSKKHLSLSSSWSTHYIDNNRIAISINSNFRDNYSQSNIIDAWYFNTKNKEQHELIRLYLNKSDLNKEFYIVSDNSEVDKLYDNFIKAFQLLNSKI